MADNVLSPSDAWKEALLFIYSIPIAIQLVYAVSRFVNIFRAVKTTNFFTRKPKEGGVIQDGSEPVVTIQICSYNEASVIEATIDAACSVHWPNLTETSS